MLRRLFLKALIAAPIALPVAAKVMVEGATAGGWSRSLAYDVVLNSEGCVSGTMLATGEISSISGVLGGFTVVADKFEIAAPGEEAYCKYQVSAVDGVPRVVENPDFEQTEPAV